MSEMREIAQRAVRQIAAQSRWERIERAAVAIFPALLELGALDPCESAVRDAIDLIDAIDRRRAEEQESVDEAAAAVEEVRQTAAALRMKLDS